MIKTFLKNELTHNIAEEWCKFEYIDYNNR